MNACVVENASVLLLISSAIRFCKYINNELLYYFISLLQVCCKVCDKNLLVLAFIFKPNRDTSESLLAIRLGQDVISS